MRRHDEAPDGRWLETLGAAECRSLLADAGVGRLAHTAGALPAISPVRFTVRDSSLVIAATAGSAVAAAGRGTVVAVQADCFDAETGSGWSVTAVGTAHLVRDPAELARLAATGPEPWAPGRSRAYVSVDLGVLTGTRVRPAAGAVPEESRATAG